MWGMRLEGAVADEQIQLQLNQGQNYVMLMSDGRGMGSGMHHMPLTLQ